MPKHKASENYASCRDSASQLSDGEPLCFQNKHRDTTQIAMYARTAYGSVGLQQFSGRSSSRNNVMSNDLTS